MPSTVVAPANRLAGKVALITGGARGIGLAVAKAYLREGAKVFIVSRSDEQVRAALSELRALGGVAAGGRCDLSQEEASSTLVSSVLRTFGRIDILVNNAGILGPRKPIIDYPASEWNAVMQTNIDSVFRLTKAALGTMIPQGSGSIINVSSGVATKGRANWGAYSVSKAALNNFTEMLAEELTEYKIRVNAINPGPTRTSMRAAAYPQENPTTLPRPEDIVNGFVYLASDSSRGLTGAYIQAKDWVGREF